MNTEAICYKWHDTKTNKVYVGWHKLNQKKLHGFYEDGYICSSKWMNEEYSKRPQDFVRGIYAWGTCEEMLWLENRILKFADAKRSPWFYNQTNGNDDEKFILKHHTEETKKNLSESRMGNKNPFYGRNHTENWKSKNIRKGEKHPLYGTHMAESSKQKSRNSNLGQHRTDEFRNKMRATRIGKHHTSDTIKKMSESRKGNQNAKGKHWKWGTARLRKWTLVDGIRRWH